MKITDIEAIACVWPPPENHFWTSFRPIGRVSELIVRVHTDQGLVGIGEAHGAGMPFPGIYKQNADGSLEAEGASRVVVDVLKPWPTSARRWTKEPRCMAGNRSWLGSRWEMASGWKRSGTPIPRRSWCFARARGQGS